MKKENSLIYNLFFAFSAQAISLLFSVIISFVVPKVLSVIDYSYWQLFVFYSTYVGMMQFGLTDGIYLMIGGKKFEELNKELLCAQFWYMAVWLIVLLCIVVCISFTVVADMGRRFVSISVAVYMVIWNLSRYLGYIFQAVNSTDLFSKATIIDRTIIILLLISLLLFQAIKWKYCIVIYIIGMFISLLYSVFKGKEIVFYRHIKCSFISVKNEIIKNISCGICLMIANLTSTLIVGVFRFIVDAKWGIEAFGKFSFAISLTNFFLVFINQVSMVLFPALRRISDDLQADVYGKLRSIITLILPFIYVLYIPIVALVELWLPQYKESVGYLVLLLPICTFDGKMQMLYNTYLKVIRKERVLLFLNILAVVTSFIGSLIATNIFDNITVGIYILVGVIAMRSLMAEIYLSKWFGISCNKDLLCDLSMVFVFMVVNLITDNRIICEIVILSFAIVTMFTHKDIIKK